MIMIPKGCLAFLILIISILVNESTGTKSITKIISLKYKTQLIENNEKSGSPSFVFGACDPRRKSWQRSCTFAIQTKKPMENLDHVKICDFQIKAHTNHSYIGQILEVHAFGEDKAILTFKGKDNYVRFAILDFSKCEATVSKIDDELPIASGIVLSTEDDIFDIVERKYGKPCGFFAFKKMILNDQGNIVTDLIDWVCNEEPHILGAIRSPLKGHLIVDASTITQKKVRVLNVNQGGK